jgi:hypothetical protein
MFASEPYSQNNFSLAKSLIFPGWGELSEYNRYQKEYILDRSRTFNYIEGVLLFSFLVSNKLSSSHEQDYETYASINAGVDWTGKNNAFAIQVGTYDNTDAYNEHCNSPIGNCEAYSPANESYSWSWTLDEETGESQERLIYAGQRRDSKKLGDLAVLMGAGMLINRLVSAFNVLAIKKNEDDFFSFNVVKDKNKTNLTLSVVF